MAIISHPPNANWDKNYDETFGKKSSDMVIGHVTPLPPRPDSILESLRKLVRETLKWKQK